MTERNFDPNDSGTALGEADGSSAEADGGVPEGGGQSEGENVRDTLEAAWNAQSKAIDGGGEAPAGDTEGTAAPDGTQGADAAGAEAAPQGRDAQPQPLEAPSNWPTAEREMFATLDPKAQEFLLRTHHGMLKAHTQRSQAVAPWRQVSERWDPYFKQLQVPAPQAIDLLLQTEYKLRNGSPSEKLEVLQKIVQDYAIGPPQQDDEGNYVEPDPRIAALEQQIAQMHAGQQHQQQAVMNQRVAAAQGQLQAFAEAKDDAGRLKFPHFGEVKDQMTVMAQADVAAGRPIDLPSLYDRAVWASPSTRSKMMATNQQTAAQKARQAGVQVAGGGTGARPAGPMGLRETLEAAYDAQVAR